METKKQIADYIEMMHLQNTNGRETDEELFRLGIEVAINELTELNLLSIPDVVVKRKKLVCFHPYKDVYQSATECYCEKCGKDLTREY